MSEPRASLYAEVTNRIVAELEAGRFPWVQPWSSAGAQPGLPRNAATRRPYSGINILLLWGAVIERGYPCQGWLTFRQALDAGGAVRKGERGTTIVYADRFTPEAERSRAESEAGDPRAIPFLKRFTVFNVAQIDGLPERFAAQTPPLPEREQVPIAEALVAATGADFRMGGSKAFYAPGADYVQVPPQPAFRHQIDYYRTALHELGHWTGHGSRLARDQSHGFGSRDYAREELCAELASAYLCAALGIVPTVRHADYLAGWLDVLRADDRAIFRAASAASKAADYPGMIAAYNAGPGRYAAYLAGRSKLPGETMAYLGTVTGRGPAAPIASDTPPRELVFVLRHDLGATAGAPPQPATDGLFAIRKGQP